MSAMALKQPLRSDDAGIGAWAIHAALLRAGWTQTIDTGQTVFDVLPPDLGTVTTGYNLYAFGDTLQSEAPFYLRISFSPFRDNYSSGHAYTFQVGWQTNGSGSFTQYNSTPPFTLAVITPSALLANCFFSGDADRFCMALWNGPLTSADLFMSVERTKDSDGSNTKEGVLFLGCGNIGVHGVMRTTEKTPYAWATAVISGDDVYAANPCWPAAVNQAQNTMADGNHLGYAYPICYNIRPYSYGLNALVYQGSDFTEYKTFPLQIYHQTHTYLVLSNQDSSPTNPAQDSHILMRFE